MSEVNIDIASDIAKYIDAGEYDMAATMYLNSKEGIRCRVQRLAKLDKLIEMDKEYNFWGEDHLVKSRPINAFESNVIDKERFLEIVGEESFLMYAIINSDSNMADISVEEAKEMVSKKAIISISARIPEDDIKSIMALYDKKEIIKGITNEEKKFSWFGVSEINMLVADFKIENEEDFNLMLDLHVSNFGEFNPWRIENYARENELSPDSFIKTLNVNAKFLGHDVKFPEEYKNKDTLDKLVANSRLIPSYFNELEEFITDDNWETYVEGLPNTLHEIRKSKAEEYRKFKNRDHIPGKYMDFDFYKKAMTYEISRISDRNKSRKEKALEEEFVVYEAIALMNESNYLDFKKVFENGIDPYTGINVKDKTYEDMQRLIAHRVYGIVANTKSFIADADVTESNIIELYSGKNDFINTSIAATYALSRCSNSNEARYQHINIIEALEKHRYIYNLDRVFDQDTIKNIYFDTEIGNTYQGLYSIIEEGFDFPEIEKPEKIFDDPGAKLQETIEQ
ncbi:MAG: hypothetical protein N4A47_03740 [Clostridia bacterium]|nr:hypothetical protein [Clostridia bacterium]